MAEDTTANAVELATELTVAWLGNQHNRISADDVPAFLRAMHETVTKLAGGSNAVPQGTPHGIEPAGKKGGLGRLIGRTKGGLNTKLHAVAMPTATH